MATANPFDILGDDDNDDPSQLIAAQQQKIASQQQKGAAKKPAAAAAAAAPAAAKLPSKPLPPAQAGELVSISFDSFRCSSITMNLFYCSVQFGVLCVYDLILYSIWNHLS